MIWKRLKKIKWFYACYSTFKKLYITLSYFIPIQRNKIVFDNFAGKSYGCDPKYITEYLLTSTDEYIDIVWLLDDISEDLPEGIRKVKYGSLKSIYELASAKIWIDNVKSALKVKKKKNINKQVE